MSYHNVLSKTDRALVAFIISEGAGTEADTYPAKRSLDKDLPNTTAFSESAKQEDGAGQYRVATSIIVRTSADIDAGQDETEPKANSEARQSATFDCFKRYITADNDDSALAAAITTAARATSDADLQDFTILRVMDNGIALTCDESGSVWSDVQSLELIVCPFNVS
jgi:hypothetical protein